MRRFVLLFAFLAVAFAPAPLPRVERRTDAPGGFREIEGHWECGGTQLHITPGRWTHSADCYYDMKINTRVRPFQVELRGLGRSCTGAEFTGIYKVEGDRFILALTSGKGPRPTTFDGPVDVYRRVSR